MPTGYTSIIEDKADVTFEEFAWRCARAFGACVMQRDDGLEAKVLLKQEPGEYHARQRHEARNNLDAFNRNSTAQLRDEYATSLANTRQAHAEATAGYESRKAAYDRMTEKVQAWVAPTPDHEGMKVFMLDQIRISTELMGPPEPLTEVTFEDWRVGQRARFERDIAYHGERLAEEEARCADRTAWLMALVGSIGTPPQNAS